MSRNPVILFIDLEWEQLGIEPSPTDSILEIGAIKTGDDKGYFNFVKTDHVICNNMRRILRVNQNQIDGGVTIEEAVAGLKSYAGEFDGVCVWSCGTKEKLKYIARTYKWDALIKKIIVLQDAIIEFAGIKKTISFDYALIAMNVNYNPKYMHEAKYDAKCLMDLYYIVRAKIKMMNPLLSSGLVRCANSKTFHLISCSYVESSEMDKHYLGYRSVIGYKPCKRCIGKLNPIVFDYSTKKDIERARSVRGYKDKGVNFQQMCEIADFFGINISGNLSIAKINTGYSEWLVYCSEDGFVEKVKHENYITNADRRIGYHIHEKFFKDVYSQLKYISSHDKYSNIRPIAEELEKRQKIKAKKKKKQKARKLIERDEWEDYYN